MPSELSCPRCRCRLRCSEEVEARWLTCPRCLASVPNPERRDGVYAVEPAAPTIPLAEVEPVRQTCPECGRVAEFAWQVCPYCEHRLRPGPRRRGSHLPPDVDATRDGDRVRIGLIALGALMVFAVILFFLAGGGETLRRARTPADVVVVGLVLLAAFVGGLLTMGAGSGNPQARWLMRVLGCLSGAAGLVCLTLLAALVALLSVCQIKT
jgi:hypothetical protein